MISASAAMTLNHLLGQQGWARERLARHAGSRLEFKTPPMLPVRLEVAEAGLVSPAPEQACDLVVTINPLALPLLLIRSPKALDYIDIVGPESLAETVKALLLELQWDFEEDLSRWVGDAAAHGIAQVGREAYAWQRDAGERLARNFSEYWTEERPLVARRADFEHFKNQLQEFDAALARAEARVRDMRDIEPNAAPAT